MSDLPMRRTSFSCRLTWRSRPDICWKCWSCTSETSLNLAVVLFVSSRDRLLIISVACIRNSSCSLQFFPSTESDSKCCLESSWKPFELLANSRSSRFVWPATSSMRPSFSCITSIAAADPSVLFCRSLWTSRDFSDSEQRELICPSAPLRRLRKALCSLLNELMADLCCSLVASCFSTICWFRAASSSRRPSSLAQLLTSDVDTRTSSLSRRARRSLISLQSAFILRASSTTVASAFFANSWFNASMCPTKTDSAMVSMYRRSSASFCMTLWYSVALTFLPMRP
mmetsp:Transcript_49155/g.106911  ORF Transcript_49155/g.106911 Transcript_49155/m.106911 type:complete len:285 (+) Transcript_49155:463-1317(+)